MNDNANDFIKRLIGFSFGSIIVAFIGFAMTIIVTWFIAPEEFGKVAMYTMAISLTSLFLYLGLDQAFIREYNAREDKKSLLWNCFLVPIIFSLLLSILCVIFQNLISRLLFESNELLAIFALAISIPVIVFHRFNTLIIRMEEKATLYSLVNIVQKVLNLLLLVLLLLYFKKNFVSIILAQFIALLITSLIMCIINREYWFLKHTTDKETISELLKYGLPLVSAAIFIWFLNSVDKIALRTWSNFYELGLYAVAFKIVAILEILKNSFATFWSPTAYRWYENKITNKKYLLVSHKLAVVLFILFGLIVILKDSIVLFLDASYQESAVIFPFLLFLPVMYTITETTKIGITFSRKTGYIMIVTGVAGGINLLGNYMLVPTLGGLGASISTGFSFIIYFWIATLISRNLWFKFDLGFYIINIALMVLLATISVFYSNIILEVAVFGVILIYNNSHIKYLWEVGNKYLRSMKKEKIV